MRVTVVLLLFLLGVALLEVSAPRRSASLGAVKGQTAPNTTNKPTTVEERTRALNELHESIRTALNNGETIEAVRGLTRAGELLLLLNKPQEAVASHLQALDLLRQSPNPELEVDNLTGSAAAYLTTPPSKEPNAPDNLDLAQSALERAVQLSREIHYTVGEAKTLLVLSELQTHDNQQTALATAQQALALWKSLNDRDGIARSYHQIGTCYLAQTLLDEATENFQQELVIWRELNDRAQQASALISLSYFAFRKAEWETSIDYLSQAYPLVDEEAEPLQMGRIAATLGASFLENGSPEMAVIQYKKALELYRKIQHPIAISYAINGLARACLLAGDLTLATIYLHQALELVPKSKLGRAPLLELLGRVQIEQGDYATALKTLESVLNTYTETGNRKEAARVRAWLGQTYYRQGQFNRGRVYYEEALTTFINQQDRVNQSAVYYALGKLEMKLGDYDAASAHLRQSIDVTEGIRVRSTSTDLMAEFSASVQERYETYVACLMKQHELHPADGFAVKAFETSEFGRARTLSEMLLAMQTTLAPGIDPKLAARQKSLQQTLRLREIDRLQLLAESAGPEKLKDLEDEIARLEVQYKKVNDTIRARFPAYEQITRPTAWDLRRIEDTLLADDDSVLLEYMLGAENSYAWTISGKELKSYRLAPEKDINDASRRVYKLLSLPSRDDGELKQAIASLSQLVVAPVAAALNRKRIILVADGALNYIPFQLLFDKPTHNEPLIARYEVVNVPSASILGQLRQEKQQRRPSTKILAAFGDPVFRSNYAQFKDSEAGELVTSATETPALPSASRDIEVESDTFDPANIQPLLYTKLELKNLTEIAGAKTMIASGFDASREMLGSLDLSQYAILHFATHGRLVPEKPEDSGFYLSTVDAKGRSQDGFITMQDVYRLHAPVDLVVLSACRTGLGKDVRGEGLIGLTRGFMYAGASSVVASLWKVDDEATAELMKHFYTNMLQKGMRPAEALRAAQNTLRQNPQWQAPHFWAGFILQGEFKEPIRLPALTSAPLVVQNAVGGGLFLILLMGIAWGFWRRRDRRSSASTYSTSK